MVNKISLVSLGNTNVQFIDGDRGKNYPQKTDFYKNGYCVFLNTGNVKPDGFDFSDLYYITQEKDEILNKGRVQLNDIVLTTRGTVGNVAIFDDQVPFKKIRINSGMVIIRCSNRFYPYFLYSFFRSSLFKSQCGLNGSGSAQPQLPISAIKNIKIPEFNLKTQQSIAAVLSALDKKIALNKQINARLEEMAKTLYDYWFVQFDFPDANGKPYKSSGGDMVFDETLKREIPKGWEVKSLGKHITIKRGISYKSNEIKDTGVPFINLNSFYLDGKFKFEGTKFFTGKTKNDDFISSGDLLIAVTDVTRNADIIGKAFILPDLFNNSPVMSCDVAKISSSELNNFYLERLFNSSSYHEYIKYFASGTLVLHLDIKGISWFDTYLPPRMLLDKFEDFCRNIYLRIVETEKQNHRLTQLRDFLLPMLMNGQVSVAE